MLNLRDDEELCRLFKVESDEHLQRLNAGLLRLEREPGDRANLRELFREAHTLKGSAGMVGATDMQAVAHRFEDMLGSASRGESELSPEAIGRMLRALDAIGRLVDEVVTGNPSGVDVWGVLASLDAGVRDFDTGSAEPAVAAGMAGPSPAQPDPSVPGPVGPDTPEPAPGGETPSAVATIRGRRRQEMAARVSRAVDDARADFAEAETSEPSLRGELRIDTIRVEARRLDSLMTHAGELTVAAARNGLRLAEMEEVLALWEEIGRIAADRHGALGIVQGSAAAGLPAMRAAADRLNVLQSREEETLARLGAIMRRLARGLSDDATKLDFLSYELAEGIRDIRMLPLSAVFNLFPRMVRDLAGAQGKEVELTIEGGDTGVDKRILEQIKDPLMHMIRNAIDHGIEPPAERMRAGKSRAGMLLLRAYRTAANTVIEVVDDGRGLDLDAIRHTAIERGIAGEADLARMSDAQLHALIFNPGFSTRSEITDISGRGVGMEVVRENIERLKGTVHIDASPGNGCFVRIHLPLTLATARMLILGVDDQSYAVPVESVRSTILVTPDEIRPVEGRETVVFDGRPVSIAPLAELLELAAAGDRETDEGRAPQALPCVIIDEEGEVFGVMVDTLIDEQEVVLKADSPLLRGVRNVAGSTILGSGRVCVILNPHDLLASMRRRRLAAPPARELEAPRRARAVLLVEDSITTRTQVKRILEAAGFEVVAAVDGVDGLSKLGTRAFDAVISDIQMPNLDGLGLTARIRQEKRYADLPVILMTSLASEEDRRRGIEVGASAYLTKPTFDQNVLLDTLRRLI